MNDEHAPRHGADADEQPDAKPGSRWTVRPGSVADTFGGRHSSPDNGDGTGDTGSTTRRRSAREIIDEVRSSRPGDDYPTRASIRRPDVPLADTPRPRLDPDYRTDLSDDKPDDVTKPAVRAASPEVDEPTPSAKRRTPLHDESHRVAPDLGERRELTASPSSRGGMVLAGFGGVILIAIIALIGAIIDFAFTGRLGVVTIIGLTLGAAIAAVLTRKRDLLSIIVAPPLIYAVIAGLVLLLSSKPIRITSVADAAINGFPAMALATGLAALVVGARLITSKVGDRR